MKKSMKTSMDENCVKKSKKTKTRKCTYCKCLIEKGTVCDICKKENETKRESYHKKDIKRRYFQNVVFGNINTSDFIKNEFKISNHPPLELINIIASFIRNIIREISMQDKNNEYDKIIFESTLEYSKLTGDNKKEYYKKYLTYEHNNGTKNLGAILIKMDLLNIEYNKTEFIKIYGNTLTTLKKHNNNQLKILQNKNKKGVSAEEYINVVGRIYDKTSNKLLTINESIEKIKVIFFDDITKYDEDIIKIYNKIRNEN